MKQTPRAAQSELICIARECERAAYSREMCLMHYKRWRKYGDPNLLAIASRYMSPVQKLHFHGWDVTESGCWEWRGGRQWNGYGTVSIDGRDHIASRVAFEVWVRRLGPDEIACHTCDNPPCINPAHLFAGSYGDNARDSARKGRAAGLRLFGERNNNAKLTNEQVKQIRRGLRSGRETQRAIAARFDVSESHVSSIKVGRSRVKELNFAEADAA